MYKTINGIGERVTHNKKLKYNELLAKLRKDIVSLNIKKHKLTSSQKSMLDFLEGKKSSSQYVFKGFIIQLTRGNESFGFEHILLHHYQEICTGKLTPREFINIWTVLEKGDPTLDFIQKKKSNFAYKYSKEIKKIDIRITMVAFKDGQIQRVLSYYSDRRKYRGDRRLVLKTASNKLGKS